MKLALGALVLALLPGATPLGRLDVDVSGLRSSKGLLRLCITADPKNFPNCVDDALAVKLSVPASTREVAFPNLAPGAYAVAVIHDENGNAKLDTMMGIPREGFGFSRNPVIRFGPPRFAAAQFAVTAGTVEQDIRVRYIL